MVWEFLILILERAYYHPHGKILLNAVGPVVSGNDHCIRNQGRVRLFSPS